MSFEHTRMVSAYNSIERYERKPDRKSYIPESYGAGFSILRNKKNAELVLAADYQFKKWSVDPTSYTVLTKLTYTDSHIYSVGFQFTPNNKRPESYIQFMRFMAGACYNQSYLKVNGFQMNDISVSFGVGFPFYNEMKQTLSYVNVAVNVGESGTGERGGISERYVLLSVNMSLIERWFAKYRWK